MTTSPSEPVDNDQSGSTDDTSSDSSKDTSKDSSDQGISDDQLPEDLQPSEDNPLAEPLEPGETSEVDLNEPSRSYAKELEEAGDAPTNSDEGSDKGSDESSGASTDE